MLKTFWKNYQEKEHDERSYTGVICFGTSLAQASEAIQLILDGRKTLMVYPANGYKTAMKGTAKQGDLNIITGWNGEPAAVIETTEVCELCYANLTDEICRADAACEGTEDWHEKYQPAIKLEIEELGNEFNDETIMIVEKFKLIYSA